MKNRILIIVLSILFFFGCEENSPIDYGNTPSDSIKIIKPVVVNTFPHDVGSFTQGLVYRNGIFYESGGRYGISTVRKVDPQTGTVLQVDSLNSNYFAEGLAYFNNQLIQLTWQEQTAFVYDTLFNVVETFTYSGEGWGLTNTDNQFIMSNGSGQLTFRNENFEVFKTLNVLRDGNSISAINELEYVNGFVYANIWRSNDIYKINAATGNVETIIECDSLVSLVNTQNPEYVLNGIAYNEEKNTFYLTGKNWQYLFEVRLDEN